MKITLKNHRLCYDCTREEGVKVLFYNADDNVCLYCGSKNTSVLYNAELKAELDTQDAGHPL